LPKLKGLSIKQQKFIDAYLGVANGNGTKAAQLAGYRGSPQTLKAVASENLTKPDIAREVQKRLKLTMTGDEVLQELSDVASADCDEPVRVSDKLKALELMGKHHKLFTDKVETSQPDLEQLAQEFMNLVRTAAERARLAAMRDGPQLMIGNGGEGTG
jgi:phage terminase small subunit